MNFQAHGVRGASLDGKLLSGFKFRAHVFHASAYAGPKDIHQHQSGRGPGVNFPLVLGSWTPAGLVLVYILGPRGLRDHIGAKRSTPFVCFGEIVFIEEAAPHIFWFGSRFRNNFRNRFG